MSQGYKIKKLDDYLLNVGESADVFLYISKKYDIQDLAIISLILYPDFTEENGFVYLSELYSESTIAHWYEKLNDYSEVQKIVNHIHLDRFMSDYESEDDEIYDTFKSLCVKLKTCWTGILLFKFPNYEFQVSLDYDSDGYDPTITFFQI